MLKKRKKERELGAAYIFKFKLAFLEQIGESKIHFRPTFIFLKGVLLQLVSNFGVLVDFS